MNRREILGLSLCVAALLACQTGRMHQGHVTVAGSQPDARKLEIAKRVAEKVYGDGELKRQIVAKFPGVREPDLVGMFLHWSRAKLDEAGTSGVVVQFGVREVDDRVPAEDVVAFIRTRCEEELARDAEYHP